LPGLVTLEKFGIGELIHPTFAVSLRKISEVVTQSQEKFVVIPKKGLDRLDWHDVRNSVLNIRFIIHVQVTGIGKMQVVISLIKTTIRSDQVFIFGSRRFSDPHQFEIGNPISYG